MPHSVPPEMDHRRHIQQAMQRFSAGQQADVEGEVLRFDAYLERAMENPEQFVRNIFQVFHDMVHAYVEDGLDEYPGDPESINYVYYDTRRLFVEGADNPFFADRLFSNRLVKLAHSFRQGIRQNKIFIFKGPHGSGKSTFLDNLLRTFETYVNSPDGRTYEALWHLDKKELQRFVPDAGTLTNEILSMPELRESALLEAQNSLLQREGFLEIPCPSHDHPILMIPREFRQAFLDELFTNDEAKWKLFTEKQYEWVFRDNACTICTSLYEALLRRLKDPMKVLQMLHVRHYRFNRRLGEGISVYHPGDRPVKRNVLGNDMLQRRLNGLLRDSNQVHYLFSNFAKTNNGVYALMDIKQHNIDRLLELHNILSEGIHRVEYIEERVNSLFLALMNPEDEEVLQAQPSLTDRIEYIKIPYVLDLRTEVEIYRHAFGRHVDAHFLPRVLHNFARIIISTRLNPSSAALSEWISLPGRYDSYCDTKLQLLKMEIYTGNIPVWLQQTDRKRLTAERRRRIIAESEFEGVTGFSGRDSLQIFGELFSSHAKDGKLIDMATLYAFFNRDQAWMDLIPEGFLEALLHMYNYTIMQEIKESLYSYNEDQIARDLKNYLFAVNFEEGTNLVCPYTQDHFVVGEAFFAPIEKHLLDDLQNHDHVLQFRHDVQKDYTATTLTQELRIEGKQPEETRLYRQLYERYVHHLKEKVLEPFLDNQNFRRAIKDFDTEAFRTYDERIRRDVTFLIENLRQKFHYKRQSAREVCIYLIDNQLVEKFSARKN